MNTKATRSIDPTRLPTPVEWEERIHFGLQWYATEADADYAAAYLVSVGAAIRSGFQAGEPARRAPEFDRSGLYAVIVP